MWGHRVVYYRLVINKMAAYFLFRCNIGATNCHLVEILKFTRYLIETDYYIAGSLNVIVEKTPSLTSLRRNSLGISVYSLVIL